MMHWTAERPNGVTRRSERWQGPEISDLQTVQNLLKILLNSGIPVKKHHYNEVKILDQLKIQSRSKNKNYSPFLSQG